MAARILNKLLFLLLTTLLCGMLPAFAQPDKAVIVVGPVDPPANQRTQAYIAGAEEVARVIGNTGMRVERLYHPYATWERLLAASRGARIFIYYGHGNGYGWYGYTESSAIIGLCLSNPTNPNLAQAGPGVQGGNAEELRSLELAPDSLVALIHTCYASGSSRLDRESVSYQLASRRVNEYANAFFAAGAGSDEEGSGLSSLASSGVPLLSIPGVAAIWQPMQEPCTTRLCVLLGRSRPQV